MALGLTKPAKDVYAPTTPGGDARGADMGDAQTLHMEIEAVLEAAIETSLSFQGGWDASAGTFPGAGASTKGQGWRVTVAGTVNSVPFALGDLIVALVNSASTSTYAANWIKVPAAIAPVVRGTDSGAGTANAIQVTTTDVIASAGGQLIAFTIYEANTSGTVTVAFNGGSALAIKTASGNDPAVGALAAGLSVVGIVVSSQFILLSDTASAAIQAAAEAAATAAGLFAGAASTSETNAGSSAGAAATAASAAANSVAAFGYAFSTTTTDSDPGAGTIRLNNATIASATAAYIDNADADGVTISSIIDGWDDSTNTIKGQLTIRSKASAAVRHVFNVTGSVVDGTGYRKLTLVYVGGAGSLTNGLACWVSFDRAGDKGADGAGAGDFVGPASSVNEEILVFDGTTGKSGKSGGATVAAIRANATNVAATINGATAKTVPVAADLLALVDSEDSDALKKLTIANLLKLFIIPIAIAASDETTALTTGTAKATYHLPRAFTVTAVMAELTIAQSSGSIFTVDVNEGGTSILSTKITIDNTEETSLTAATQPVVSDASLAAGAKITVDIDQIGDGTAKGLKVWLLGYWT